MGCNTCSSGGACHTVTGCNNNGGCLTGGCNKMNVFDWLGNMDYAYGPDTFNIIEVRFKGGRKGFYHNANDLELVTGDAVIVEEQKGHHFGFISLQGELVRLQMKKKQISETDDLRIIYRKASENEIEKYKQTQERELSCLYRTREIIKDLGLEMKLSDIEFQADNTKAIFYYSAEERVDFRELIKMLAAEFNIRVEMLQVSLRVEAGRLGGIGDCGRELCCSTWLTDFQSVFTSAARYQNLSLNPTKLAGQCGKLKCCLNYELDTYMEALKEIPTVEEPLLTKTGEAKLQKTDIFRKIMWFAFENENTWHSITTDRVNEIMQMNKKGEKPGSLSA
ncbi:MAG: Signal peptidase-like protein [Bacteroidetes bacterium]|nr:Signal peptidase-like protein [Bacteroidota bacterium]